ncbi:BQ5605_C038g11689 [Microbotryum silenes-dioicae]|uniref:BQ5605_C038g11689 protein n=1 Tax=Microbotryum silenes-dioicae TaxID=796604 RepID=A0A2X0MEN3_9BASI|nr:BQ5605_C038g11689 [Microbotryum silenes-dioicae]
MLYTAKNSYAVQGLVTKMRNPDADLRFMALNDLISEINRSRDTFGLDDQTEHSTVEQILTLTNDLNGEVKNLAVKALAALCGRVSDARVQTIITRLTDFAASKDEGVRDIASLGLKTVVASVVPGTPLATTCCSKLAPKVIAQLQNTASSSELLLDSLELLSDILSRFESSVRNLSNIQNASLKATVPLLKHSRPALRKRAVATLSTLVSTTNDFIVFDSLVNSTITKALHTSDTESLKTSVLLVGSLARAAPSKMGRKASNLVPLVLATLDHDDDDLRESALQSLELLVLKCPTDIASHFSAIVDAGTRWLKHDPNYSAGDDEDDDVEMGAASDDGEEDEDDEDFGDEYSDDDDTSWKVRRSATKLLTACIQTRADLLSSFYHTISPALIARFSEREETVKVEVWGTYTALLAHTKVWGRSSGPSSFSSGAVSPMGRLKRKRSSDQMDTEEGPIAQLSSQTPIIAKSIIKQLNFKSLQIRQAGFALLHELIAVLDGGVESQITQLVARVEAALKTSDSGLSGAATQLKIEVLSFLALFYRTHPAKSFSDELSKLVPLHVATIQDKFNKIAAEAFVASTALVKVLCPIPSSTPVPASVAPDLTAIYDATMKRLASPDADEEVKAKGIVCLGALLYHAGDLLSNDFDTSLEFLRARLQNEVSRLVAVKVIGEVAESPVCKGDKFDTWINECLVDISMLLRKIHRPLKVASFQSLVVLLGRASAPGSPLPSETSSAVLIELQPLVNDTDINLLPLTLQTLAALLVTDPVAVLNDVEASVLPRLIELVQSPLLQHGPALDALLEVFEAYVRAGADPLPLVQTISKAAIEAPTKPSTSGEASNSGSTLSTASRSIGIVVREVPSIASGLIAQYSDVIASPQSSTPAQVLAFLSLGEIGRSVDLEASRVEVFPNVVKHFGNGSEEVRRAAAYAAGNIAVGNTTVYLPALLEAIESGDKKRYLALQSLKEVIVHSSPEALASISDALWTPLFDNSASSDEGARNVGADCLGKLTVMNPAKCLPQLQSRLNAESKDTRATVIAAIRFTFTNESSSYDLLLAPLIVDFFKLIHDPDLGVRRLALSSLSSAAHNKPHLVREHLSTLLPELYQQTVVNEALIRIVEMGPFKHKVDDGLDLRKTAYECMHTLLDECIKDADLHEYLGHVVRGLTDEEDVKKLCYLMLVKLAMVAPIAVAQRLDECVPAFKATLDMVLKDSAVKQETERLAELQKSTLRCIAALHRRITLGTTTNASGGATASSAGVTGAAPKFAQFVEGEVLAGKHASEFKQLLSGAE